MNYTAVVNEKQQFELAIEQDILVEGAKLSFDLAKLSGTSSHIIYNHKSFHIELIAFDAKAKTCKVKVNHSTCVVNLKDQYDALLERLGIDNTSSRSGVKDQKAPMPGLVLNIFVKEGDAVNKGDNLLVLEAMKMENMIKSPTDGVIQKIEVKDGEKVEKNQSLIRFQ